MITFLDMFDKYGNSENVLTCQTCSLFKAFLGPNMHRLLTWHTQRTFAHLPQQTHTDKSEFPQEQNEVMLIKMFAKFIKVEQCSCENWYVKANLLRPMYVTINDKKLNSNLNYSHSLKTD